MKYQFIDWDSIPDVINKDQFYRICHISKSTALHLLKSGKVPCEWTGKKTRCYKIKKEDVKEYLQTRAVYPELYSAPSGWYGNHYVAKLSKELPEEVLGCMHVYYSKLLKDYNDVLTVKEVIPKQEMLKWIYGIKEVYIWNNRKIDKIDEFDLSLADMLYVSGSSTGKDMKLTHKERSWSTINTPGLHRLDTAPQMTGYIKNFAWHYENEVRIRIQLPYSTGYEKILLDIPQSTIDSFQITTGPNFVWKDDALFKQYAGYRISSAMVGKSQDKYFGNHLPWI